MFQRFPLRLLTENGRFLDVGEVLLLALDILTVGENTGHLGQSMEEVTRSFRNDLTRRLGQLTTLVSSGALLGAFILVTLIAIGIITSVMGLSQSLSQ